MVVIADSPLFSTLVAYNAANTSKGTALTIVNSIGFAITILSIQILKVLNMDETSLKMMGIEARKNVTERFNVEKMCFSTYSEYKRLLN